MAGSTFSTISSARFTDAAIDLLAPTGELVFGAPRQVCVSARQAESMFALNQSCALRLTAALEPRRIEGGSHRAFNRAQEGALTVAIGPAAFRWIGQRRQPGRSRAAERS